MKAVIAVIAVVLLGGCASMQAGTYIEYDAQGRVVAEYQGSAMGAAAIGVSRREEQAQAVQWDCNAATTAAGQQQCYQAAMVAQLVSAMGGGVKANQSDVQALVGADAQKYAADRAFWGNVTAAGITGGTSLLSQAIVSSAQKANSRELYKTFRTFAENGGSSTYQLGEAEVGGDVNLTAIGGDGAVAGNDIGQATIGGDLIGRDSVPNDGDGIGGQPLFEFPRGDVSEGGGDIAAPTITTNPVDANSQTDLF